MAKRDTAEYLAAADDTLRDEPLPESGMEANDEPMSLADSLAAEPAPAAAAAFQERAPLTTADITYLVRLAADFLPGGETQTVRVFGRRCLAIRGATGGVLVVTSLADMRTLLRTVSGDY